MLATLYRKIVPKHIRDIIYRAFLGDFLVFYRNPREVLNNKWYRVYYSIVLPKNAKEQAYKDWGIAGYSAYPYVWKKEYDKQRYEVTIDSENGLPFVMHNGKRLYFKRGTVDTTVEFGYRQLLIEQDPRSAHRYVKSYEELKGKTLLDMGTAEGNFTLDTIEYVDHAYLFECDEAWIEALEATFAPWRDKITIVRKYVSDVNDENNVSLDIYFQDKPSENLFLKMDIEGYERKALEGAAHLLTTSEQISGSICIYHLQDDESVITDLLSSHGLKTEIQPGYLYRQREMRHAICYFSTECENRIEVETGEK